MRTGVGAVDAREEGPAVARPGFGMGSGGGRQLGFQVGLRRRPMTPISPSQEHGVGFWLSNAARKRTHLTAKAGLNQMASGSNFAKFRTGTNRQKTLNL